MWIMPEKNSNTNGNKTQKMKKWFQELSKKKKKINQPNTKISTKKPNQTKNQTLQVVIY